MSQEKKHRYSETDGHGWLQLPCDTIAFAKQNFPTRRVSSVNKIVSSTRHQSPMSPFFMAQTKPATLERSSDGAWCCWIEIGRGRWYETLKARDYVSDYKVVKLPSYNATGFDLAMTKLGPGGLRRSRRFIPYGYGITELRGYGSAKYWTTSLRDWDAKTNLKSRKTFMMGIKTLCEAMIELGLGVWEGLYLMVVGLRNCEVMGMQSVGLRV